MAITRPWTKTSSNDGSSCVETQGYSDGSVEVRDSKDPSGPVLTFTRDEWVHFEQGVRDGKHGSILG